MRVAPPPGWLRWIGPRPVLRAFGRAMVCVFSPSGRCRRSASLESPLRPDLQSQVTRADVITIRRSQLHLLRFVGIGAFALDQFTRQLTDIRTISLWEGLRCN
jgi:hypothetical protein